MNNIFVKIAGSVVAGCLMSGVLCAAADNLIQNPGFEEGSSGWSLFVPKQYAADKVEFETGGGDAYAGSGSAVVNAERPIRYALTTETKIPVSPGEKFRVRGRLKFGEGASFAGLVPGAYIRLTLLRTPRSDIDDPRGHYHVGLDGRVCWSRALGDLSRTEAPSGWQAIDAVVEIPDGCNLVSLGLFSEGVSGPVQWDEIAFERVPDDTAAAPVAE
jgi:hypothetical protein